MHGAKGCELRSLILRKDAKLGWDMDTSQRPFKCHKVETSKSMAGDSTSWIPCLSIFIYTGVQDFVQTQQHTSLYGAPLL